MKKNTSSVKTKKRSGDFYRKYGLLFVLVMFIVLLTIFKPQFISIGNILNVLRQLSINGVLAIGMTFVIILGGIDLSVGSLLGVAGIFAAVLAQNHELPVIVPILAGCGMAMGLGILNGLTVALLKVPAFITTLGMLSMARSICFFASGGHPIAKLSDSFLFIGAESWLGIPVPIWILTAVFVTGVMVLSYTKFGRYVYAIGGNEEAAVTSGLKVKTVKVAVYAISGLCSGIAGIILTSRITSGIAISGESYELDAIAAVVMGGTSLSGGQGRLWGTIVGILLIGVINNGLVMFGVSAYFQLLIKGLIIILAVALDVQSKRKG